MLIMPLPDMFYDKYDDLRVPAVLAAGLGALGLFWAATVGYPNSLKDRTVEKVEDAVVAMHPGAYVLDGSVEFNIRGKIQSTTDGEATVVVAGEGCDIKFDTTTRGVEVYPKMGDVACAPLLQR
jgi:hypothetical protein